MCIEKKYAYNQSSGITIEFANYYRIQIKIAGRAINLL